MLAFPKISVETMSPVRARLASGKFVA